MGKAWAALGKASRALYRAPKPKKFLFSILVENVVKCRENIVRGWAALGKGPI